MSRLMRCGHAAQARDQDGNPVCVICVGLTPDAEAPAAPPDLTGRKARCVYDTGTIGSRHRTPGDSLVPSSTDLPFFEYCGPGTHWAALCATCSLSRKAHEPPPSPFACNEYAPRGASDEDRYYCGCYGWD